MEQSIRTGTDAVRRAGRARGKRGRPPGSVSLTKEKATTIINYIRAGAFDYVAAEAAGVSERTFHDWVARGEGRHPTRTSTPKLRAFAETVRTARAEARLGAEVKVYRERPAYWLSRAARTKPNREGWTDSANRPSSDRPPGHPALRDVSDEELETGIVRLLTGTGIVPRCPNPRCRCVYHDKKGA